MVLSVRRDRAARWSVTSYSSSFPESQRVWPLPRPAGTASPADGRNCPDLRLVCSLVDSATDTTPARRRWWCWPFVIHDGFVCRLCQAFCKYQTMDFGWTMVPAGYPTRRSRVGVSGGFHRPSKIHRLTDVYHNRSRCTRCTISCDLEVCFEY